MESDELEKEFEDEILKSSTPRLRLKEAQVLDDISSSKTKITTEEEENENENENENEIIENILDNPEQIDVEKDNFNFLREIDSAIENIQKWKDKRLPEGKEIEENDVDYKSGYNYDSDDDDNDNDNDEKNSEYKGDYEEKEEKKSVNKVRFDILEEFKFDEIQTTKYADEKTIHSLEELLYTPRNITDDDNNDKLEEKRVLSENLVRLKQLEEEVRLNESLRSQQLEEKVMDEEYELEQNMTDLEARLRSYNDELDKFLSSK